MSVLLLMLALTLLQTPAQVAPRPRSEAVRSAAGRTVRPAKATQALALQVMLDRAGFSPGVIDGRPGKNTDKALALYKESGREADAAATTEALVGYTVTPEDAAGPFAPEVPGDLMEQSKLEALAYRNVLEALAERFHATPELLQRLNRGSEIHRG